MCLSRVEVPSRHSMSVTGWSNLYKKVWREKLKLSAWHLRARGMIRSTLYPSRDSRSVCSKNELGTLTVRKFCSLLGKLNFKLLAVHKASSSPS